jgi:hypothetical protein
VGHRSRGRRGETERRGPFQELSTIDLAREELPAQLGEDRISLVPPTMLVHLRGSFLANDDESIGPLCPSGRCRVGAEPGI